MYRYCLVFCILLSMLFLHWSWDITNFTVGDPGWFADIPTVQDWRTGPDSVDWSTNRVVSSFYKGGENRQLRQNTAPDFFEEAAVDTQIVAADYYAITISCYNIFPDDVVRRLAFPLEHGYTAYLRVYNSGVTGIYGHPLLQWEIIPQ